MKTWKCSKKSCRAENPVGKRKCWKCGKLKPPKRVPAHKAVLKELTYDDFIKLNGGEFCWIHKTMGFPDPPRKGRLHRDHDHITGKARGLLCWRCNTFLKTWVTIPLLKAATSYLEKSEKGDTLPS